MAKGRKEFDENRKFVKDTITLKDAKISNRNFAGRPGRYNAEGVRSYCVVIEDKALAEKLKADGWNVKWSENREHFYMPVAVNFDPYPPRIVLRMNHKDIEITPKNCGILDDVIITKTNMVIRPYNWVNDNGESRVKAYCRDLLIVAKPDIFEDDELEEE